MFCYILFLQSSECSKKFTRTALKFCGAGGEEFPHPVRFIRLNEYIDKSGSEIANRNERNTQHCKRKRTKKYHNTVFHIFTPLYFGQGRRNLYFFCGTK